MQDFYPRPRSPFDASALERLRRMGLAGADGQADQDAMAVFAHIFAGQFFDDLCDYYQNSGAVRDLLVQMLDSAETAEPKQRFLLICVQYDAMYRTLPDPIWWLSGSPAFAEPFADGFLAHLQQLYQTMPEGETP